jgi:hypothetical protein
MKIRNCLRNLLAVAVLLAIAPASSAAVHDLTRSSTQGAAIDDSESEVTLILAETAKPPVQSGLVRTTGGIDTTGWVLIAVVHGPDAALVREGQRVRAFSVNSRTRMHLARVTRVTRQQNGVRVEATLATRVLGTSTRYLMEIVTESI